MAKTAKEWAWLDANPLRLALRRIAKVRGISFTKMVDVAAAETECSRAAVYFWLNGQHLPTLPRIVEVLKDLYGVTPTKLTKWIEERPEDDAKATRFRGRVC